MATPMFEETMENLQHSTQLISDSRGYTLHSNRENLSKKKLTVILLFEGHSLEAKIPDKYLELTQWNTVLVEILSLICSRNLPLFMEPKFH
jgi:hypothetical protein